jgi:hypothetical protein
VFAVLVKNNAGLLLAVLKGKKGLLLPSVRSIVGIKRFETRDMGMDIAIVRSKFRDLVGRVYVPVGCL